MFTVKHQNKLRQEKKYIINIYEKNHVIRNFLDNGFKKLHDSNIINNIYFDDNNFNYCQSNIDGDNIRKKVRVRWYNDTNNFILEKKHKFSSSGKKSRERLNFNELSSAIDSVEKQEKLTASCQNKYYREYYHNENNFRLTIDSSMCFSLPNKKRYISSKLSIIEIKFPTSANSKEFVFLPKKLQLSKFSKYVYGLSLLRPEIFIDSYIV